MIRGLKRKPMALIKRIRKSKAEATGEDKPAVIKTHLRNMIVVPEMIGGVVGIHSGKVFNQVEIKVNLQDYLITCINLFSFAIFIIVTIFSPFIEPEMVGHYLGEFSLSYQIVRHGRPGVGATGSSKFVPLK